MSVQLVQVTFGWLSPVLSAVELTVPEGWTAVVGANGAGKTTLLRLVAGELVPNTGTVRAPEPVHLCPQRVEQLHPSVEAFAWDWSPLACRLRGRLDLDPDTLERWETLSQGERKRWQIGAALAAEPLVLLLDEPTNHLDAAGRELLLTALRSFRGVGFVVSHDRTFLDALGERTVVVEGGGARLVPLRPSEALALRRHERAQQLADLTAAQDAARVARQALADARRGHEAAGRSLSSRRRVKGPRDHDGRSMAVKFRAEKAERQTGRAVELARGRLERLEGAVEGAERPVELGRSVFVRYEPAPRTIVLAHPPQPLLAGDRPVLEAAEVSLERGAHVHLAGPNGAGKTTLLRALLERSTLPDDRLLYVPQEISEAEGRAWLQRVRALPRDERGRILQVAAALGLDPHGLLDTTQPSPGEARKLAIAFGLGLHAWAAVLDEPTNHLDLPSIERLEAALAAFPGALLLVTHDEALARACCSERWTIRDRRLLRESSPSV